MQVYEVIDQHPYRFEVRLPTSEEEPYKWLLIVQRHQDDGTWSRQGHISATLVDPVGFGATPRDHDTLDSMLAKAREVLGITP